MCSLRIFPNGDTMNGIFDALKRIDGSYESQYSIEAAISAGKKEYIYSYPLTKASSYFAANDQKLKIKFKNPLFFTDYSFATSGSSEMSHSHPKAWNITGTSEKGETLLLDEVSSYTACNNARECHNSVVKTFHAKYPRKVSDIMIMQTASSSTSTRIVLRSIELFGSFLDEKSLHKRRFSFEKFLLFIMFLIIS